MASLTDAWVGTVLDPFMGFDACRWTRRLEPLCNRIEVEERYCEWQRERLAQSWPMRASGLCLRRPDAANDARRRSRRTPTCSAACATPAAVPSALETNRKSNAKYRARTLKVNRAPAVSRSESERVGRLAREARQQAEAEAADARRAQEQIESLASLWALQGFEVES